MAYYGRSWIKLFLLIAVGYMVNAEQLCEDKVPKCAEWRKKDLCNERPKYKKQKFYVAMGKLCKKSCDMCGDDDDELFDTDARCKSYSSKGYCDQKPHQGFMLRRCKYSCRNTIRHGISSPGRGNYQAAPGVQQQQRQQQPQQQQQQQQQNVLNQYHSDYTNPQHWGQQYAQQYAQQYPQQQQQQGQQYGAQQNDAQQNGAQQYGAQQYGAQQYGAQQTGAQQNPSQVQQNDAQKEGQQPSLMSMPVELQAMGPTGESGNKKHKVQP